MANIKLSGLRKNIKTFIWQKKNAQFLFKEKQVNGETIKLYKVPDGNQEIWYSYRDLVPIRKCEVQAGSPNPAIPWGPIDVKIPANIEIRTVEDLQTGRYMDVQKVTGKLNTYSGFAIDAERYKLDPLPNSQVEYITHNKHSDLPHSAVAKMKTKQGDFVKVVKRDKGVNFDKITFYLNGKKIGEETKRIEYAISC